MWSLAWWPHALFSRAEPPGHERRCFAPDRIDLAAHHFRRLNPLAGILGAPLTLAFGPIASYNLLMAGEARCSAAFFAFLLLPVHHPATLRRACSAAICSAFSTYILGHMQGHLQLVLIFSDSGPRVHLNTSA